MRVKRPSGVAQIAFRGSDAAAAMHESSFGGYPTGLDCHRAHDVEL